MTRSLGGAKYLIVLSIAHCDWVVYAVSQYRRQTNGPLAARCPCMMVLGKKNKKKLLCPLSASAHWENARFTNPALARGYAENLSECCCSFLTVLQGHRSLPQGTCFDIAPQIGRNTWRLVIFRGLRDNLRVHPTRSLLSVCRMSVSATRLWLLGEASNGSAGLWGRQY